MPPTAAAPRAHPRPTPTAADRVAAQLRERLAAEGLPELLAVDEVARIAGVHRATVWTWLALGLARVRVGRVTRVPAGELVAWLAGRVVVGEAGR